MLALRGTRVIVAGLDMDFLGNPFGPMPQLLAIADYITKLHAICVKMWQYCKYFLPEKQPTAGNCLLVKKIYTSHAAAYAIMKETNKQFFLSHNFAIPIYFKLKT